MLQLLHRLFAVKKTNNQRKQNTINKTNHKQKQKIHILDILTIWIKRAQIV